MEHQRIVPWPYRLVVVVLRLEWASWVLPGMSRRRVEGLLGGWVGVLAHCWVLGQQDRLLVQHMIAGPLLGLGGGVVWGWLFRACGLVPAMLKH